jgi:chromosome condensin MukBEF ATPase and DNA-binding subunit MukB
VEALHHASEEHAHFGERAEAERKEASARAEVASRQLTRDRQAHASLAEASDAKQTLLTQRLEATIKELQVRCERRAAEQRMRRRVVWCGLWSGAVWCGVG